MKMNENFETSFYANDDVFFKLSFKFLFFFASAQLCLKAIRVYEFQRFYWKIDEK